MHTNSLSRSAPLAPGARVALVAPSGPLRGDADVERGIANARAFGWEAVVGEHVLAREDRLGYFAASDARRADDFNRALRDSSIDAIWFLRGGYGTMRILDALDYAAMRAHPRPLIGYSDITGLHAAFGLRAGVVGYHGPNARATITPFAHDSLARALMSRDDPCATVAGSGTTPRTVRGGRATGRLAGGNLSLVAALCGTAYMPDLRGAILVLEDVNEGLYRIDRMLVQLALSGALRDVAGIAFGLCTGCDTDETPDDARLARTLDDVLREVAHAFNVPCVAGFPIGHVDDQWTLPLGATATLDADVCMLTVHGD